MPCLLPMDWVASMKLPMWERDRLVGMGGARSAPPLTSIHANTIYRIGRFHRHMERVLVLIQAVPYPCFVFYVIVKDSLSPSPATAYRGLTARKGHFQMRSVVSASYPAESLREYSRGYTGDAVDAGVAHIGDIG